MRAYMPEVSRRRPACAVHWRSWIFKAGGSHVWSDDGGEAILQLVADHLSDHAPLEGFWPRRQNQAEGVRCHR